MVIPQKGLTYSGFLPLWRNYVKIIRYPVLLVLNVFIDFWNIRHRSAVSCCFLNGNFNHPNSNLDHHHLFIFVDDLMKNVFMKRGGSSIRLQWQTSSKRRTKLWPEKRIKQDGEAGFFSLPLPPEVQRQQGQGFFGGLKKHPEWNNFTSLMMNQFSWN